MLLVDCIQYEAWYTKMTQKKITLSSTKKSFGTGFDPQSFGFYTPSALRAIRAYTILEKFVLNT